MKADVRASKTRPESAWRRAVRSLAAMELSENERLWNTLERINERVSELEQSVDAGCEAARDNKSLVATNSLNEGKQL